MWKYCYQHHWYWDGRGAPVGDPPPVSKASSGYCSMACFIERNEQRHGTDADRWPKLVQLEWGAMAATGKPRYRQ